MGVGGVVSIFIEERKYDEIFIANAGSGFAPLFNNFFVFFIIDAKKNKEGDDKSGDQHGHGVFPCAE